VEPSQKQALISDFVNRRLWAVVGASQDRSKYGNRVFRSLRDAGYTVFAVNPNIDEVEGASAYSTLADLPQAPEVVDIVVPPKVTEKIVKQIHELGLDRVWMQPGAESKAAIEYCQKHGIEVVYDACAMVHKRYWKQKDEERRHG
jgi:hypothetical protein